MDALAGIILAGVVIEAVVQLLKAIWDADARSFGVTMIVVLVLSLLIAILGEVDILSLWWDTGVPIVNQIITGLALARVAMWVHDLYKRTMMAM